MFSSLIRAIVGLARAVTALVEQLGRFTAEPTMAERSQVALQLSVSDDATGNGGSVSLAIALNDRQKARFSLAPSTTDADGQPINGPDGQPIDGEALNVSWSVDDSTVAGFDELSPNGHAGVITSGKVGSTTVHASIAYPDGSAKTLDIFVAVGNSAPGDPAFTAVNEDEPAPTG